MQSLRLLLALCLVAVTMLCRCTAEVQLHHLSTLYLPYRYTPQGPLFGYNQDAAEQTAYDPYSRLVYNVANNVLHVIDARNVKSPRVVFNFEVADGTLSDIDVCRGYVAVSVTKTTRRQGRVLVYSGYRANRYTNQMTLLHNITVGPLPDVLLFSRTCRHLVVAVEGNLGVLDGRVVNPEGTVAIITFSGGNPSRTATLKVADFTRFNPMASVYLARGVRQPYKGEGTNMSTTFSQDLEPEYVAINDEETIAYVVLQENNAIATVDLDQGEVIEIYPLGSKSWRHSGFDASDRDGRINIKPWPIDSYYMPDGIRYLTINGRGYVFAADEGHEREYESDEFPFEFSERVRGRELVERDLLDSAVDDDLRVALSDDRKLGRLLLSTNDGINPATGKILRPHAFGGRGFSVWDAQDLSLVYNSGGVIEHLIARYYPQVFNSDAETGTPSSTKDSRSPRHGPEPEAIEVGWLNDKVVIFVGGERPGTVSVFSIGDSDMRRPLVEGVYYSGGLGADWEQLWNRRISRDLDPEDIKYIPGSDSPNGEPLCIVTGSFSGTVTFYQVVDKVYGRSMAVVINTPSRITVLLSMCLTLLMLRLW